MRATVRNPRRRHSPTGWARGGRGRRVFAIGGVILASWRRVASRARRPAAEVERVHATLHAIDRRCIRTGASTEREAQMLAGFARRYPQARFRDDDENARGPSLLLVTRQTFPSCDPRAAAIVERTYRSLG